MKSGFCNQCPKRSACTLEYDPKIGEMVVVCKRVRAELRRVENPKRKGRIELIYEADMPGTSADKFDNCVWGSKKE